MELRGVVQRTATQPVNERETLAGRQLTFPFPNVTVTTNENADLSVRKLVHNQLSVASDASAVASSSGLGDPGPHILPSEEEGVVDIQQTRQLQNCVTVRSSRSSETVLLQNLCTNVPQEQSSCNAADEFADLLPRVEEEDSVKKRKSINYGDDADIIQFLDKMPSEGGVILRGQKVLSCDDGVYKEGEQYTLVPGHFSKGAYGEAALCQDLKTGKTFMRKTVKGKLSRNEIEVPLKFRGEMGIPEVYGVNINNKKVEIFQEFAGVSLKNLMEWDSSFVKQLRDYKRVLVIAFQAFATLVKLHSQGITHQDIKPENLCLSIQSNDFGSSQTLNDQVIEGLTYEYLSPESCNTILQVATGSLPVEKGCLGPGADVWALGLSLLYCLCGYHVMVYVCTRNFKYTEKDPAKLKKLRMQCLFKIGNLTDEDFLQELICPEWPENLKILLKNVLHVDPEKRWSAKHAAEFLQDCISCKQQPAHSGASAVAPPASTAAAQAVGAPAGEAPTAPVVVAPRPATFQGLTPARLMVQTRPQLQIRVPPQRSEERASEGQAVQCTSPMRTSSPPHPSMSPMSVGSPPHPSMSPMSTGSPPHPSMSPMSVGSPPHPSMSPMSTGSPPHPSMSPMSVGSPPPPPSPASSLDTPPPSQLPAFMDLLSNTTTPAQKSRRRVKAKQRVKPY